MTGVFGMTIWGMGVLYYCGPVGSVLRIVLATALGLGTAGAWRFLPRRRMTFVGLGLLWTVLLVWWHTLTPSNRRDWQPDVLTLPSATVAGQYVTLHNIRNVAYRTETDFTPQYYDKTFDLRQLDTVDLLTSYWAGNTIAHVFVSFGFGGRDYVAVSVEIRKERHENYAALRGFFKQYELIYVVADERDVIRLRTTYRQPPEDVYLYRTRIAPAQARNLFMSYVQKINTLVQHPEFYNTLTTNCTTSILFNLRAYGRRVRYHWKLLLSGYAAEYAYERGGLDTSLPFAELKQRSHINVRAREAHEAADFSQRLRAGLAAP